MEDILGLIAVLIIYFVSAKAGKARRQANRAARQERRSLRTAQAAFGGGAPGRQATKHATRAEKKAASHKPDRPAARPAQDPLDADCEERPIHLHSVSQQAMHEAEEGEDPCHAGGAKAEQDAAEASPIYGGEAAHDRDGLAQDLLRGVIVSEILTRPSERAAIRRNRRRA